MQYTIKLNLDVELLREQITQMSMVGIFNQEQFNAREGVVNLLEEITDQAEGVVRYQGTPVEWNANPTAEELRELLLGFADVFRGMVQCDNEAAYRQLMHTAPCHFIDGIDSCPHCSRQIAAHQALAKLRKMFEPAAGG